MANSKASKYKQTFYSQGTYSKEKNEINLSTEIPMINLSDSQNTYELTLRNSYDISSKSTPCMLVIYSHGHPTHRNKLESEGLNWDEKTLPLNSVFQSTEFTKEKILVITLHDEDFEEWHIAVYRFFVEHHVSFNSDENDYFYDLEILENFIAGESTEIRIDEEPKTVGGGTIDPSDEG